MPFLYTPRWVYLDLISIGICTALLASTILGRDCFGNRILSRPVFVWLGEISFGVYLLHRHAQWIVDEMLGDASRWATLAPKIAVTLVLAELANRLIERPCHAWLRKLGDRFPSRLLRSANQ